MHIKKIYKNEARPRPFRPDPAGRRSGKWSPVDIGAADAARYGELQAKAQKFHDDPRGYVEGKWVNLCSNMLYRRAALAPHVQVRYAKPAPRYFDGPGKKPDDEIYALILEFSLDNVPDYLVKNLTTIIDKAGAKEGLFVNNSKLVTNSKYPDELKVQLGYMDALPNTSREGDALAEELAKSTVNIIAKVQGIVAAEKDRKFGKTSEALDDSIIDEIASAAADLPKGDWHSYEKVQKVILPKYRDDFPVGVLSDAIAAAVGL